MALQVVVQLPDAASPSADITFSGRYEATRDDLDCVAVFDGSEWRLELVQGLVKTLKTDRYATSDPRLLTCIWSSHTYIMGDKWSACEDGVCAHAREHGAWQGHICKNYPARQCVP